MQIHTLYPDREECALQLCQINTSLARSSFCSPCSFLLTSALLHHLQPPPKSTHFYQSYQFFFISSNWLISSHCVKTTHRWKLDDEWRWKDQRGNEGNLTESSKTWRKMRDVCVAATRESKKEKERPDQRAGGGVESVKRTCNRAVGAQAFSVVLTDGAACCREIITACTYCVNNTCIKHLYTSH